MSLLRIINGTWGHQAHAQLFRSCRDALSFCQVRQREVSMLTLKHIGAAAIATVIATAMVIDTADARRGGGGGGGARASGLGGGARVANVGSVARVSNPTRRADIGRPGYRPGWGWGGGWGGPGWGWGAAAVGAAAVGTGLAYASSNYCDPYYAACNGPYANYGSYAYAPPTYGANYGAIVPASPSYGSYANGTFGSLGATRATTYAVSNGPPPEAIADCARRFRSYDPASQTYLSSSGQRVPCP
jgi:hypothetical protein